MSTKINESLRDPSSAAFSLYELATCGKQGVQKMRDEVSQLNQMNAGNPDALKAITREYKDLTAKDPLYANEVKIGPDGSLTFTPNTVTSKVLRAAERAAARDLKEIDAIGAAKDKAGDYSVNLSTGREGRAFKSAMGHWDAIQKEEHLLAAAPMNIHGEPVRGYTDAQRAAMDSIVDRSLQNADRPAGSPVAVHPMNRQFGAITDQHAQSAAAKSAVYDDSVPY